MTGPSIRADSHRSNVIPLSARGGRQLHDGMQQITSALANIFFQDVLVFQCKTIGNADPSITCSSVFYWFVFADSRLSSKADAVQTTPAETFPPQASGESLRPRPVLVTACVRAVNPDLCSAAFTVSYNLTLSLSGAWNACHHCFTHRYWSYCLLIKTCRVLQLSPRASSIYGMLEEQQGRVASIKPPSSSHQHTTALMVRFAAFIWHSTYRFNDNTFFFLFFGELLN